MIYPENFEIKTGFDQIRELIKSRCLFRLGAENTDKMAFSDDFDTIRVRLNRAAEFREIIIFDNNFPSDNYHDITPGLKRARVEGTYLEAPEVFMLKKSLETLTAIFNFFKNTHENKYPALKALAADIKNFPFIEKRIDSILDRHGNIKDSASKELKQIRDDLFRKHASVGRVIQGILKRAVAEGIADKESAVSIRNGRQVIPVPVSSKNRISGIIHDESATGRTAYVEPAEVVELNNAIRELEIAEQNEIIRILVIFTDDLRPYISELLAGYIILGTFDFIRAVAMFSIDINAVKPALVKEEGFTWKNAMHPLLLIHHRREKKEVVPLDISLDKKNRILLISGPNAGGKSVCLKTVGLLQYMLQCGLPVPMSESSEAGIFTDMLIDIGDEQSIENDLSTYSSHLQNMKVFLKRASGKSLVLMDEFGAGTEPQIGGAIAEAILEKLNKIGTYGVITTHYSNLKYFASATEGIKNGAMLFDTGRMKPLFRLEIGKPGSSFAIDIARQIGLPEDILVSASSKAGEEHVNIDKHLREIIRDKRYWEQKRENIRVSEKKLENVLEKYEGELSGIKQLRKEIVEKAKAQADEILAGANREIENTIRQIRESQADREITKTVRKKLLEVQTAGQKSGDDTGLSGRLEDVKKVSVRYRKSPPLEVPKEIEDTGEIIPGDMVKITESGTGAEVLDVMGENLLITFGESMMTTVKKSAVKKTGTQNKKTGKPAASGKAGNVSIIQRKLEFKSDIDVRGKRGVEAIDMVQRFIDDATVVGVSDLRILHGKGNGILRQLIRDYLESLDIVKTCTDEHVERGGAGITVVKLDF